MLLIASVFNNFSYPCCAGDVCFDKSTGFWLVHSVPKFPPVSADGYSYPQTGQKYGQSFLCVTYGYAMLNDIGWFLPLISALFNHSTTTVMSVGREVFALRDLLCMEPCCEERHILES